jgi:hypothetical protein
MAEGNAHNRFLRGVKRLSQLYDFSMHCYAHVVDDLKERLDSGALVPESHIISKHGFLLHHRVANTLTNASDFYPKQLRSVVLVRLVSEFEVFLIDLVHEAAKRAHVTFRDDARLNWPRGKVLSFDSIEELKEEFRRADCRSLSSGGFDEIRKYYQKHLGFDISPPHTKVDDIREIHARRHLHVHNLGMVDHEYNRAFKPKLEIGFRLGVSDQYLRDAFALFRLVAHHVAVQADHQFPTTKPIRLHGSDVALADGRILYFTKARFTGDAAIADYFDLERQLNNAGPQLKSIFLGGERMGNICEWSIVAAAEALKAFFVDLRDHQKKGHMKVVEQKRLSPKKGV